MTDISNNPGDWFLAAKQNVSDILPNAVRGFHVQTGSISNLGVGFNFRAFKAIVSNNPADRADYSDIQTAINFVNANGGGIVFIKKGTYIIGDLTLYSNVDLIGEDAIKTILNFNSTPHKISLVATSNCTISTLTIKNSTSGVASVYVSGGSFITIENCQFSTNTTDILAENGVNILNISHNYTSGSGTFIYLNSNGTRSWFENNYVLGCSGNAIVADTTNGGSGNFIGNSFNNIVGSIFYGKFSYSRMSNNISLFFSQVSTAYQIDMTSGFVNLLINGNVFTSGGNGGARFTSGGGLNFIGNTVSGSSGNGLQIASSNNCAVSGNLLNCDSGIGLLLSSSSIVTCTGNKINSTGLNNHGISCVSQTESTITGNWVQAGSSGTAYAVNLDANSNNNAVVGNRLRGTTGASNNLGTGNVVASNA